MTQKDHSINVICTKWFDNKIELKKKKSFPVADISLFGYQGKVDYEVLDDRIRITPPCINPNNFKGQYAYVFNIKQA